MPAIGAIIKNKQARAAGGLQSGGGGGSSAAREADTLHLEPVDAADWLSRQSSPNPGEDGKTPAKDEAPTRPPATGIWRYQEPLGKVYKHTYCEVFVAALIVGNFLMNMVEKTIDPDPDDRSAETLWVFCEYLFNIAFFIELLINMYSFWLWEFWNSGWNVFDFIVVSIGMCSVFKVPLPGPLKLLRMMRAFRVFRLFKRVKSLKKIMESLARAVPGVINAFVILVLVMCIYAILGVEFFRVYGDGGTFLNEDNKKVALQTARGQDYGWEYFGNFPKSFFTMFQVLTGESWSEAVCRPLMHGVDALQSTAFVFFFVSFVVLTGIILINVVIAVLLEKMVEPQEQQKPDVDVPTLVADVATIKRNLNNVENQVAAIVSAMQRKGIVVGKPVLHEQRWNALDVGMKVPQPPTVAVTKPSEDGLTIMDIPGSVEDRQVTS